LVFVEEIDDPGVMADKTKAVTIKNRTASFLVFMAKEGSAALLNIEE
jgi:hypothetical protein